MVRKLEVIKVPRDDPLIEYPIDFPPFENLHLELLENKKKLKPGLPLIAQIPRKFKPKPLPPPVVPKQPPKPPVDDDEELVKDLGEKPKASAEAPDPKPKTPPPKPKEPSPPDPVEQEMGADSIPPEVSEDTEDPEIVEEEMSEKEIFCQGMAPEERQIFSEMTDAEQSKYMGMTQEQRERYQKEVYIWKWRLLQRSYPSKKDLPDFNEHSDLHNMKTSYERTVKELHLEDNIESYRTYLVFGWIGIEFACTQWLGIDLSGFTQAQTKMMYKYERLLIELGERPYSKWGSSLPVEVRILGLILFQAAVFYLAKVLSNKFGATVGDLFQGITGQPPVREAQPSQPQKRKMRGPRINVDDIRKMKKEN